MSFVQAARVCGLSLVASSAAFVPAAAIAQTAPNTGMMRFPDVSQDKIVFVYANDLWLVSRDGGVATPLASPPGQENFPRFSADGNTIAFMGNYEGDRDLYTIPTTGGVSTRVTHHPAGELLSDWAPDGSLIFSSNGQAGLARTPQLFTVKATGGLPTKLPVPYGVGGTISSDGTWLAYTPHNRDTRTWKRYRGGMASDVWLFNLKTNESRKVTDWEGTDTQPMWHGDKLYYLSDGGDEHRLNLWVHENGRNRQLTRFSDYDVKWPSMGPGANGQGEIVFENGGNLYLFNLQNNQSRTVDVIIPGDRPKLREHVVDASAYINSWDISPTGKRAVVEARGDVWTLPAENGTPRNLTDTDGAAERMPTWSPDGRWISYFSDASGEYELYITQSDGKGETKQLTNDNQPWKMNMQWSPNSENILFSDKSGKYYLHNVETGLTKQFDRDPYGNPFPGFSFSHDNRWIAYAKSSDESPLTAVYVYDTENEEVHKLTSGMFSDNQPTFDRKGDWMFFSSQRNFNSPTYGDSGADTSFAYTDTGVMMAVPLRTEDFESPWLPKSDEETWDDESDDESDDDAAEEGDAADEGDADDEGGADAAPDDGLSGTWTCTANTPDMGDLEFTLVLTLNADGSVTGTFNSMMGGGEASGSFDKASGTLTLNVTIDGGPAVTMNLKVSGNTLSGTGNADGQEVPVNGSRASGGGDNGDAGESTEARETVEIDMDGFEKRAIQLPVPPGSFGSIAVNDKNQVLYGRQGKGIMLFDMSADDRAEKTVSGGSAGFAISGDGKKLLVPLGRSAQIMNAAAGASGKNVVTSGMDVRIEPRKEWAQLLRDAWRIERDFFYVENLHGVDWDAVYYRYAEMLDDAASREDVAFIIGELISELNVGHAYSSGGDTEGQPNVGVGMLGVDYEVDNGAYRIAKIYDGGAWDIDARNPLREPGVNVEEGDYLLAVNGMTLSTDADPWRAFIGTAGKVTSITVSDSPEMNDDAREVLVKPMGGESNLRYRDWIETNRAYVEAQTDGKVGYIYVPNTGVDGQNDLFRQFFGQMHKQALIIDERWNGGGQIPTRFIELLNRPTTNYWARRNGKDWHWPPDSHQGPKCMLINGMAGSGGDMFPWLFRQAGLGPLIGMRTWGGLVGMSGNPGLIDGARVTAPTFGFYEKDGTWGVEGHGTDADIEVVDDPALMVDGGDPQLDRAIEEMLKAIEANPFVRPSRPADPDRSGMGVTDEDK